MPNTIEYIKNVLLTLSRTAAISGNEQMVRPVIENIFCQEGIRAYADPMGNLFFEKDGTSNQHTIFIAAHVDEIGLMVSRIDEGGYVNFKNVGGIDQKTLFHQEVQIHGKKNVKGVITSSALQGELRLIIDTGYPRETVVQLVQPGDYISFDTELFFLYNNRVTGKALDDRAGIACLAGCLQELNRISHTNRIVFTTTVQEEVGLRGAMIALQYVTPSIAIAVDVTHAQSVHTNNQVSIQLGNGPAIALGPNIDLSISTRLQEIAVENRIPYQLQPVSGPTGTDAKVLQLTGFGIPTGLLSVPLRYMHSTVEMISLQDIVDSGRLLAYYIASLTNDLEVL